MVFGIIIIIFQTHLVFASENFQTRFGNVTLNIPHPKNLCLLKNTTAERLLFESNSEIQKKSGNKLLAYWIDCVSHKKIQTDGSNELSFREWVMVVGTLTGSPKKENTYPKATAKQFLKAMVKQSSEASIDDIKKNVNKMFSEYDLEDYPTVIDDPINLGILGITDSLHFGFILRVKAQGRDRIVAGIMSTALINGVPMHVYYYRPYKDKNTIKALLSNAKYYSIKLVHAN